MGIVGVYGSPGWNQGFQDDRCFFNLLQKLWVMDSVLNWCQVLVPFQLAKNSRCKHFHNASRRSFDNSITDNLSTKRNAVLLKSKGWYIGTVRFKPKSNGFMPNKTAFWIVYVCERLAKLGNFVSSDPLSIRQSSGRLSLAAPIIFFKYSSRSALCSSKKPTKTWRALFPTNCAENSDNSGIWKIW